MSILSITGSQLGFYKDSITNYKIPCLPGNYIIDPNQYSSMKVPILGAYTLPNFKYSLLSTRTQIRPIAGTTSNDLGQILPISQGQRLEKDGLRGRIVDGVLDPESDKIIPVLHSKDKKKERLRHDPTGQTSRLIQSENSSRRNYYTSQNKKEEQINKDCLNFSHEYLIYLNTIDVKTLTTAINNSDSDFEIDKKLLEIALPILQLSETINKTLRDERERRKTANLDVSNVINENLQISASIIDPIIEMNVFNNIEFTAMSDLSLQLEKLAELSNFASRRLNGEVFKLKERFEQLNSVELNPDIGPAKAAAEHRFTTAVKILISEVTQAVNNRVFYVINAVLKLRAIRNLVLTAGDIANSGLSSNDADFVAFELEWRDILIPKSADHEKPLLPLIKNILKSLKERDKIYLAPDHLAAMNQGNVVLDVKKEQESDNRELGLVSEINLNDKIDSYLQTSENINPDLQRKSIASPTFIRQKTAMQKGKDDDGSSEDVLNEVSHLQLESKLDNEAMDFLRNLRDNETQQLLNLASKYNSEKYKAMQKLTDELAEKLKNATSDEERAQIINDYKEAMKNLIGEVDSKKKEDLDNLINQILSENINQQKKFYQDQKDSVEKWLSENVNKIDEQNKISNDDPNIKIAQDLCKKLDEKFINLENKDYQLAMKQQLEKLIEDNDRLTNKINNRPSLNEETAEEMKARFRRELAEKMKFLKAKNLLVGKDSQENIEKTIDGLVDEHVKKRQAMGQKLGGTRRRRKNRQDSSTSSDTSEQSIDDLEQNINNLLLSALDASKSEEISNKLAAHIKKSSNTKDSDKLLFDFDDYKDKLSAMNHDRKKMLQDRLNRRIENRNRILKERMIKEFLGEKGGENVDSEIQLKKLEELEANLEKEALAKEDQLRATDTEKLAESFAVEKSSKPGEKSINHDAQLANILAGNDAAQAKILQQMAHSNQKSRERLAARLQARKLQTNKLQTIKENNQVFDKIVKSPEIESYTTTKENNKNTLNEFLSNKEKLLKKHAIETDQLLKIHLLENEAEVKNHQEKTANKRSKLRSDLLNDFDEEIGSLDSKFNRILEEIEKGSYVYDKTKGQTISQISKKKKKKAIEDAIQKEVDLFNQKKADLEEKADLQLSNFDADTEKLIEKYTSAFDKNKSASKLNPRLLLDQANQKLSLQETQIKELAELAKYNSTSKNLQASNQESLDQLAEDFRIKRLEIINKANEKLLADKQKKSQISAQKKQQIEDEIKNKQDEYDQMIKIEEEKEIEKINKEIAEKLKKSDANTDMDLSIIKENADLDEATKDRLIKDALANQKKLRDQLAKDQNKAKKKLMERLNLKKSKKKQLISDEIHQKAEMAGHFDQGEDPIVDINISSSSPTPGQKIQAPPKKPVELPNLSDIEKELQAILNNNIKMPKKLATPAKTGISFTQVLLDPFDKQFTLEGDLAPVLRNEFSKNEYINLKYGRYIGEIITKSLTKLGQNKANLKVSIEISKTLPGNNYNNNAFRRSFYYDEKKSILWIRSARLSNISDFLVIICHCLSHILNNNNASTSKNALFDDSDDDFLNNLYVSLKDMQEVTNVGVREVVKPVVISRSEKTDEVVEKVLDGKLKKVLR